MKKLLLAGFALCLSGQIHAGQTTSTVKSILVWETGNLIYVYPASGVQNAPACHNSTGNGNYYSFSLTRPRAKEYYAGLLAAQAQGLSVNFWGKGACIDQSISETLDYFQISK